MLTPNTTGLLPFTYAMVRRDETRAYATLADARERRALPRTLFHGTFIVVAERDRVGRRAFVRSAHGTWVAQSDLTPAVPSRRRGLEYEPGAPLDSVGFTDARVRAWPSAQSAATRRGARPLRVVPARAAMRIRESTEVNGQLVARTDAGWIPLSAMRVPEVPGTPHGVGATDRWVDIDTTQQLLVAFEGTRPVYATLVSTGTPEHPTEPGVHRVWAKFPTRDMDGPGTPDEDPYALEQVPWAFFFYRGQALHGAYWHDEFGTARSHGCVNLPPRDARWLFDWAPPRMPAGWSAAHPTGGEAALIVRVR